MDQEITESHLPGQYLDIALVPGQYLDIALAAGQYKIYCPALAFDPPTQSVTCTITCLHPNFDPFLNQVRQRTPGFLKLLLFAKYVCVCVSTYLCVRPQL